MPLTDPLHARLLQAFGEDLPIYGGPGTETAPIRVATEKLQDAVDVQMRLLRCLGAGSGAAWRLVGQEVVSPEGKVVRAIIESIVAQGDDVVARQEAIYFVFEALPPGATTQSLPTCSGFVDPRSGIRLPAQLGWLHFNAATDNESDSPGRGWSIAYQSRAMEGTVRIYDLQQRQETDSVESEWVVGEFRTAIAGALSAISGSALKQQALFKDPAGRGRCLLALLDNPGDSMAAVLLTVAHGCFVQAHLTFDASTREFGRMAHETMEAFVDALRPEQATTS